MISAQALPVVHELLGREAQCGYAIDTTYMVHAARQRAAERLTWEPSRCLRAASHTVEGRHYCALHAGAVLLATLTVRDDAIALQRAWDSVGSLPSIDFTSEEADALLSALSAVAVRGAA